jgi:hypothetical protein
MKAIFLRLTLLTVSALFTVALGATPPEENPNPDPGGGGGGGCQRCEATSHGNGIITLVCDSPDSGEWGKTDCTIETYPEGAYCIASGDPCCVD